MNSSQLIQRQSPRAILILATSILVACGGASSNGNNTPAASTPDSSATTPIIPTIPKGGLPTGWKLVWADEFDQDGLVDANKWDYDTVANRSGWYNHELQYYSRARLENANVNKGVLNITALKESLTTAADYGGQSYTSARLLTKGKASWTYGFFEIRAKLPCGLGTWPAIWMLGSTGTWPDNGEIDIMEHVGKNKGQILGSAYSNYYNWANGTGNTKSTTVPDVCDNFHNYQLRWEADQLVIGVDDQYYFQFVNAKDGDNKKWPFNAPQYLLLNLAIGGDLGGAVDDKALPQTMQVEYVRVYQP